MVRNIVTALALTFSLVPSLVHADSYYISISAGSKTAAKVGPTPFVGKPLTSAIATSTVNNALKLIKSNKSAAIRIDAVANTFGDTFTYGKAIKKFNAGLTQLAKSGKPEDRFIRSYSKLVFSQKDKNPQALAAVNSAAAALPNDASIQLGAFRANAENKQVATAKTYLQSAFALGKSSSSSLVKNEMKSTLAYLSYGTDYTGLVK